MAQRRLVLVREDRLGHRLEQRHEALQSVGQRPGRDRQPLVGQPRGHAVQGPQASTVLEQEACPEADPVGRPGEQPRHRGRRHFQGRRCAVAIPAPPGTDDPACVGLDFDLDDGRGTLAVRHVGLRATGTHPRILRRIVLFGSFLEPGPLRAAMAGGAALLTALTPGARLLLLLALAPVERLRQHGPSRAKPASCPSRLSVRACEAFTALRSRATSMRSDMIVLRLLDSTPACKRSVSSRATSAWKKSASFAARRTSFVSSEAAFSLFRQVSSCHFSEPARERESTSARRSSSARACAASARACAASARARSFCARVCACSYRDRQSGCSHADAAMGGDQIPSSPSASVRAAP